MILVKLSLINMFVCKLKSAKGKSVVLSLFTQGHFFEFLTSSRMEVTNVFDNTKRLPYFDSAKSFKIPNLCKPCPKYPEYISTLVHSTE